MDGGIRSLLVFVGGGGVFRVIHHYGGPAHANALVLGAIFVALRFRYDNLLSRVLAHSFSNLLGVAVILLAH